VIEVIFLAGAETDVQAAYERRESFREGAGDRFLGELALTALSTYTLETNRILVLEAQRWMTEVLRDHISTPERTPERR
jgi:hypothetical protein